MHCSLTSKFKSFFVKYLLTLLQWNSPISALAILAFHLHLHNFFGPGTIPIFWVYLSSSILVSSILALCQYWHPSLVPRSVFFIYIGIFFILPDRNHCYELIVMC